MFFIAKLETAEVTNDNDLVLEYVGEAVATRAELGGGEDYIYLPTSGTATSKAFTATVYDNAGLVMDNAEVEWSLPGQPDTISISNDGVITLTPQYPLTDDNGVDVVVRATVKGTNVTDEKTIHIHNTARATTWDIVGPAVIKDGTAATYSVANVKDQYGNDFTGENTYTLTSDDAKATIEGLSITPNVGTSRTQEVKLTVASVSNPAISAERTVTVYGYDFYEPGTGEATYGTPRMETVNGVNSIVWPASVGGKVLKKYCATVGIYDPDKARPHALRRTFACNLIADGIDIKMVAELMGHKNIEVTHKYYTQYAIEKRKEVMQNFDITGNR